jgi:hypothetical protein
MAETPSVLTWPNVARKMSPVNLSGALFARKTTSSAGRSAHAARAKRLLSHAAAYFFITINRKNSHQGQTEDGRRHDGKVGFVSISF